MERKTIKPTKVVTMTADEERWRNSSVYPEILVSSRGRVKERDYQKVVPDSDGCFRIYSVPAKTIQSTISHSGNAVVQFYSKGKWVQEEVAFLVAKEFVPNEDPSHYSRIKYRDNNKANLNASNLYWDGVGMFSK